MIKMDDSRCVRRVLADGLWYICNITHNDNVEHWSVAFSGVDKVVEELKKNGLVIIDVKEGVPISVIEVDRSRYHIWNMDFHLNQCEDIFQWFQDSEEGDFTHYYKRVVFHHPNGRFYAAEADDINNFIEI